jgi:UDP-N-acetylmuramoyl-tripeptide--D-alanyl-D-alanine ligase
MSSFHAGETLADDVILVDQSHVTRAVDAVEVAKSVSAFARGSRRVVAVAGALDFSGDSDYDNLSAFGALMVRLNITQVFAVGQGARALFLSVGMEGSWDGESRFCENADSAYDDIRALLQPGDVLLILGSTEEPLSELASRVKAELS